MRRVALIALAALAAACSDRQLTTLRVPGTAGTGGGRDAASPDGDTGPAGRDAVSANCNADLFGYAKLAPETIGGKGSMTVTVTTIDDLLANINVAEPRIVRIDGMIEVDGQLAVGSDKTIVGVGAASGISGGGFNLADVKNVIIRNIVITKPRGKIDAIQIYHSEHVWIDHCDLSSELHPAGGEDTYDGLIDIVHASDNITVSWTRFHDHVKVSLIGHSDTPDPPDLDVGKLHVTYHHNFFYDTGTYNPSIRFGTLHAYNNYYLRITQRAISSRMGARTLAEANFFETVPSPLTTDQSDTQGFITETEKWPNIYDTTTAPMVPYMKGTDVPLAYPPPSIDPADDVPTLVPNCAGTLP